MLKSLKIILILNLFLIKNLNSDNSVELKEKERFIITTAIIALLVHKVALHIAEEACLYVLEKPLKDLLREKIVKPIMQHIKVNHNANK